MFSRYQIIETDSIWPRLALKFFVRWQYIIYNESSETSG